MQSTTNEFNKSPIRFLIRDTKDYHLDNQNFIFEEINQLKRNDIPYFFGFLGSKKVYYYSSKDLLEIKSIEIFDSIKQKVNRSFNNFEALLDEKRINRLFKQSLLILISRFVNKLSSTNIAASEYKITLSDSEILFESKVFNIRSKIKKD
jgi:hypothetical protein